ncbi:hypothetical protein DSL72_000958 [Monilinia vaccinii-corymbosi]|uniref:Uncharacterized protein n=1 Tax=Monilinia vaccinii-corymbosi TaxID=61207 RepID=A0A8A3P0R6_9HELO|nr:hypothetical protein DSL72_000958 [Monilinia vaccinii-corymbosi]
MVTTRGRARELADSPSVNGDSTVIDEGTPVPKKRERPPISRPLEDDEVVDTPRSTRSSRSSSRIPLQARDGEVTPKQQSPQVVEEVPAPAKQSEEAQTVEGISASAEQSGEAQTVEEITVSAEQPEGAQMVEEIPSSEQSEESRTIEADEEIVKTTAVNGDVTTSSITTTTFTTPVAKKHKRFDSAEPEPVPEEKPEVIELENNEDESSDDDDDAPEEVATNQAAKSAKEKEREAAKAIEEQEAASKKKRQEKNALLKRQSDASSKKRKLDVTFGPEEMLPPAQKPKVEESPVSATSQRGDIEMDEESNTLEGDETADGRLDSEDDVEEISRTFAPPGHLPLPALLPAEYLEDNDDEPAHILSELPTRVAKASKLRRLFEKRPKDKRVGSTTFRVTESRNSHLAPKASNQARALKESWLQGRAGSKIKSNRKPFNQGFIKPKN